MDELTSTRHNLLIDPHLHIWGTEVTIYLFLGGLVGGIMVLTGLYYFVKGVQRESPSFIRNSMLASPVLLSIGMFCLFLDLANKWHLLRFYFTFRISSPMSWGAWVLIVVYPVSIAMIVLANRGRWWVNWYPPAERLVAPYWKLIAAANVLFGAVLALYTGILLSVNTARPFWNNGVLAPLFLISGISTGAAFMILFHDGSSMREKEELGVIKLSLIGAELGALVLFVSALLSSAANQRASVHLIMGGPYTAVFWVFVVGIGLLVPLLLQLLEIVHKVESRFMMPVLVLVGGFALRYLMIEGGQLSETMIRIGEVLR